MEIKLFEQRLKLAKAAFIKWVGEEHYLFEEDEILEWLNKDDCPLMRILDKPLGFDKSNHETKWFLPQVFYSIICRYEQDPEDENWKDAAGFDSYREKQFWKDKDNRSYFRF